MEYTVLEGGTIFRHGDRAYIPPDPDNRDYQKYLAYLKKKDAQE